LYLFARQVLIAGFDRTALRRIKKFCTGAAMYLPAIYHTGRPAGKKYTVGPILDQHPANVIWIRMDHSATTELVVDCCPRATVARNAMR
jgi:hypothetical protein